jgi:hypothetical protein
MDWKFGDKVRVKCGGETGTVYEKQRRMGRVGARRPRNARYAAGQRLSNETFSFSKPSPIGGTHDA